MRQRCEGRSSLCRGSYSGWTRRRASGRNQRHARLAAQGRGTSAQLTRQKMHNAPMHQECTTSLVHSCIYAKDALPDHAPDERMGRAARVYGTSAASSASSGRWPIADRVLADEADDEVVVVLVRPWHARRMSCASRRRRTTCRWRRARRESPAARRRAAARTSRCGAAGTTPPSSTPD